MKMNEAYQDVYTLREAAVLLRVSDKTMRQAIQSGDLQATKADGRWQITRQDWDDYLKRHTIDHSRKERTP